MPAVKIALCISKDVVDTAIAAGNFKTLATALQAAGLVDTLKGEGPFTVWRRRSKGTWSGSTRLRASL